MPVELYIKIVNAFLAQYPGRNLSAELCAVIGSAVIPIYQDIESGKYDIKRTKNETQG